MKKTLAILLLLAMLFALLPNPVSAEEVSGGTVPGLLYEAESEAAPDAVAKTDPEGRILSAVIPFQVNPLYEGLYEPAPEDIPQIQKPGDISTHGVSYQSEAEAVKTIRKNMKNRTETYTIYVYSTNRDYNALFLDLLNRAMVHTGTGDEGDYLLWHLAGWGGDVSRIASGEGYNYTYTYETPYYTTAAEEALVTQEVKNLIANLGIRNKSDYEKVCAVYDWICDNVTYDYDNLEDSGYKLKFTAYAALVNKTAVCQGYALLFYRLMLELGVDARFIGGDGGGPHAWNIVQLGDYYYNLDATWDAGYDEHAFFLQSTWNFLGHYRDPEFDTWEFHMDYPMAGEDYVHGGTATLDPIINMGVCGTEANDYLNAIWIMMRDGTLVIEGEGAMYDYHYSTSSMPYWYYWSDHIEKVEVGEGITHVGNTAFYLSGSLTEASLPDSLTSIGGRAFAKTGLTAIDLPESLTTIANDSFEYCSGLTEVEIPGTVAILRGFGYCENLKKVVLNEGTKTIESQAFRSCTALENINFPDSLLRIDGYCFYDTALTELDFNNVVTIKVDAFNSCKALTELTIPETLTTYKDAFRGCSNLQTVTFEEGVTVIPEGVFEDCGNLTTVNFPSTLTTISGRAFRNCKSLTEVTLPEGLESIGSSAFAHCYSLSEIDFPDSLTSIDWEAFYSCTSLTEVTIPNGVAVVYGFGHCSNLVKVNLPDTATTIGRNAFAYCTSLAEINMPKNLEIIKDKAFERCIGLQKLTFPKKLKEIGFYAFYDSENLKEFVFTGDCPEFSSQGFYSITATAYYPANNATWTEDKLQDYGGEITWVPYTPPCDHSYQSVVTEPTCKNQGYTTYTCSGCGDSYVADYTDPLGHSYEEGKCIRCGEADPYYVKWYSGTTSLNGTIDLNMYVLLGEKLVNDPNTFVRFTFQNRIVDVPMADALHAPLANYPNRYRFSCPMFAKQVADQVTVQVMNGNNPVGDPIGYSVMQYCNNRIKKSTNANEVAMCKGLLNYATAAQMYFNYNTDNLANASLSDADKRLEKPDLSAHKYNITGAEPGIKAKSATVTMESEIRIRVYFILTGSKSIEDYTFTIDGVAVQPRYNDKGWYIESEGIAAKHMEVMHDFCVGGITVHYSALSYVNSKLSSKDPLEVELAKALYAYYSSAEAFLGE